MLCESMSQKIQSLHNSVEMLFLFEYDGYALVSNDFQQQ